MPATATRPVASASPDTWPVPPEGHEQFAEHLDYAMEHHPDLARLPELIRRHEAGEFPAAADSGGDDTALNDDDDVLRNQRQHGLDLDDPVIGGRVLKYMNDHPELCAKYGTGAFGEAAKLVMKEGADIPAEVWGGQSEHGVNDLDDEDGHKCLRYMADHPELAQKYGDKAFTEAAKILKLTFARSSFPTGTDGDDRRSAPARTVDLNDPRVGAHCLRYMNDHNLAETFGDRAFMEAARRLRYVR